MCKCLCVAFIAISGGDLEDSCALKQWWRKPSARSLSPLKDIKTILYSIIFYMALRAPAGATAIWFGGQDDIPCLRDGIFERARQVHQELQPRVV